MTEEKKYPQLLMNENFITYNFIFVFLLFVSVIILFNDTPETDFEILINSYLIKGRGVYSHIYPFQSEIISNLAMILAPFSAIYLAITSKYIYLSESEIINTGIRIEKHIIKVILRKLAFIVALLMIVAVFIFLTYIDTWDLVEIDNKTLFVHDTVIYVLFLPYLFYTGTVMTVAFLLLTISHPIIILKPNFYYFEESKKEKMSELMKKEREKIKLRKKND